MKLRRRSRGASDRARRPTRGTPRPPPPLPSPSVPPRPGRHAETRWRPARAAAASMTSSIAASAPRPPANAGSARPATPSEAVEPQVPPHPGRDPRVRARGERLVPGLLEPRREPPTGELPDPAAHRSQPAVRDRELAGHAVLEREEAAEQRPVGRQGPRGGGQRPRERHAPTAEIRDRGEAVRGKERVRACGVQDHEHEVRPVGRPHHVTARRTAPYQGTRRPRTRGRGTARRSRNP